MDGSHDIRSANGRMQYHTIVHASQKDDETCRMPDKGGRSLRPQQSAVKSGIAITSVTFCSRYHAEATVRIQEAIMQTLQEVHGSNALARHRFSVASVKTLRLYRCGGHVCTMSSSARWCTGASSSAVSTCTKQWQLSGLASSGRLPTEKRPANSYLPRAVCRAWERYHV